VPIAALTVTAWLINYRWDSRQETTAGVQLGFGSWAIFGLHGEVQSSAICGSALIREEIRRSTIEKRQYGVGCGGRHSIEGVRVTLAGVADEAVSEDQRKWMNGIGERLPRPSAGRRAGQ
jgi:hypothetical protein